MIDEMAIQDAGEIGGEMLDTGDLEADPRNEEVVSEHAGQGDDQARDGGEHGGGEAGGECTETAAIGDAGEAAKAFHDAPDGAEESEDGGAAEGTGDDAKASFETEGGFAYGALHGFFDGVHFTGGDATGGLEATAEVGVNGVGIEEVEGEFAAGVVIDVKHGGLEEALAGLEEGERMGATAEVAAERSVGFADAFEEEKLPGHGDPTGDGKNNEKTADDEA